MGVCHTNLKNRCSYVIFFFNSKDDDVQAFLSSIMTTRGQIGVLALLLLGVLAFTTMLLRKGGSRNLGPPLIRTSDNRDRSEKDCHRLIAPNVTAMRQNSEYFVPTESVVADNYTVLLLTHARNRILMKTLSRYAKAPFISKIVLLWNNPGVEVPKFEKSISFRMPLVVKRLNLTSLNERFYPYPEIETDGKRMGRLF